MSPVRLLCVDDNDIDAELVRRVAARLDPALVVERAADGDAAVAHLVEAASRDALPQLVLLDLNMPRMDGHDCLRAIRAIPALDGLIVIVLTTSMRRSDRERAAGAGATGYLVKPLTREVLAGAVDVVRASAAPDGADGAMPRAS